MNDTTTLAAKPIEKLDHISRRVADKADTVINSTQRVANDTLDALHGKVDTLREKLPGTLHRAAAQVDELARQGIERASRVGTDVRARVGHAGDRTVTYIRDEPVKSVLFAVGAGAAIAALIGMLSHLRSGTHHH